MEQTISNEVALRIALATRVLPGVTIGADGVTNQSKTRHVGI